MSAYRVTHKRHVRHANYPPRNPKNVPPPGPDSMGVYDDDQSEFIAAMDAYQRKTGIRFPKWSEALFVLKGLGYHR